MQLIAAGLCLRYVLLCLVDAVWKCDHVVGEEGAVCFALVSLGLWTISCLSWFDRFSHSCYSWLISLTVIPV